MYAVIEREWAYNIEDANVTTPRRIREWELAHDGLSELVSRLSVRKYQEALNEAYSGPTSSSVERRGRSNPRSIGAEGDVGQGATGPPPSDPTSTAYQVTSRQRYCLRLANKSLDDALVKLEEAAARLEEILKGPDEVEQGARDAGYLRLIRRVREA